MRRWILVILFVAVAGCATDPASIHVTPYPMPSDVRHVVTVSPEDMPDLPALVDSLREKGIALVDMESCPPKLCLTVELPLWMVIRANTPVTDAHRLSD